MRKSLCAFVAIGIPQRRGPGLCGRLPRHGDRENKVDRHDQAYRHVRRRLDLQARPGRQNQQHEGGKRVTLTFFATVGQASRPRRSRRRRTKRREPRSARKAVRGGRLHARGDIGEGTARRRRASPHPRFRAYYRSRQRMERARAMVSPSGARGFKSAGGVPVRRPRPCRHRGALPSPRPGGADRLRARLRRASHLVEHDPAAQRWRLGSGCRATDDRRDRRRYSDALRRPRLRLAHR